MSGHSKWSTIKRKKGKADAARGKVFTKIGREIVVSVRSGGPDPDMNSRLRDVIAKAKAANMPNENIQRSIKKASGELSSVTYDEITYEGYGVGGSAVLVETMTDNKNRTVGEVRHAFDKNGGSLGTSGSVAFQFEKKGMIVIDSEGKDEDTVMEDALDASAEDFSNEGEAFEITTAPEDFSSVPKPSNQRVTVPLRRNRDGAHQHGNAGRSADKAVQQNAGYAGRQRRRAERVAQRRVDGRGIV
jgi:YebC/PmpR family DNA-binding regulatory protein